jgi:hypothetical protein
MAAKLELILIVAKLLLAICCTANGQTLSRTPANEADAHRALMAQHPERWRDNLWFELSPVGDASMARYEAANPNATRRTAIQQTQYCVDQFGNRVPCGQPEQQSTAPHPSRCRIEVVEPEERQPDGTIAIPSSFGSGTLIDNPNGRILTCNHLFPVRYTRIICTFPNGTRYAAVLKERDVGNDLAILHITSPGIETLPIATDSPQGILTVAGFGPSGEFAASTGRVISFTDAGSAVVSAPARQGDSGGGAINANGQLVGVIWGCDDDDCAYLTCGRPLAEFLDRALPDRTGAIIPRATPRKSHGSPGGRYSGQQPGNYGGLEPVQPVNPPIAATPETTEPEIDWDAWQQQQQEIKSEQLAIRNEISVLVESIREAKGCDLSEITKQLNAINNRISTIESKPASAPAESGPQISYYDIVPR